MLPDVLVTPKLGKRTGHRWLTLLFAAPFAVAAVVMGYLGAVLPWAAHPERDASAISERLASPFDAWLGPLREDAVAELLGAGGYDGTFVTWSYAALILCALAAVAMVLTFVRRPAGLRVARLGFVGCYVLAVAVALALWSISGFLQTPGTWIARIGYFGEKDTHLSRVTWWWDMAWPCFVAVPPVVLLHVLSYRASAIHLYTGDATLPRVGDRLIEDVRTWGSDPAWRKSWMGTIASIVAVFLALRLLAMLGCSDRYYVPEGSGDPVVQLVQVVQPKQVVKEVFIVNPRSAISFYVPKLEDSEVEKQVEEMTEMEYESVTMAMAGATGVGGGKKGGWPEGMGQKPVRFIRLRDFGPGWDDGMDQASRADVNFLDEFNKITGFRVAEQSEAITIRQLSRFDKGFAPPFVYMTGDSNISISRNDTQLLREYLLDGGLLFADAGHPNFDRAFRSYITRELFPDNRLLPIADDDPIFRAPYQFPNGAPPLWHHGGRKAMGVYAKVNGRVRLVVFYHPGDINDAWKQGNSGLDRDTAQGAFHMGINIVYYSFTNYLEDTRKYRK